MFGSLDISASALVAQRTRLESISANIAGAQAIENPEGEHEPFQKRITVFAQGDPVSGKQEGVHVKEIIQQVGYTKKYEPGHPFADENGMVTYPDISPEVEVINAMAAFRAYEANVTAAEATKAMLQASLRLLA
ncbi:MAG: flagellar basal body rod protein FlgC [Phycisphaeraceae bacterium]